MHLPDPAPAVIPALMGPLQVLLALLPALILAFGSVLLAILKPRTMLHGVRLLWGQKGVVLLLGLSGFGAMQVGRWALGALATSRPTSEVAGGHAPLFRGCKRRLGWADGERGPSRGGLNWQHARGGEGFFSSPCVSNGRIYVASATLGLGGGSGAIYCFDAASGEAIWTGAPNGYRPTFSSPVVAGDDLVCGEGLHYTEDARIVCLDARNGQVRWTFGTRSHVECTAAIEEGRVYIGAGDDGYYCLDLAGDGKGGTREIWHVPASENYRDCETSLIAHAGKLYAGLGVGGNALVVFDGETGRELHRLPMPFPVFSPPAICDGALYIGMGNGDFVKSASELGVPASGQVVAVDLATLQVKWNYPLPDTVLGAVAVDRDEVIFCDRSGKVYALGLDGKLRNRWDSRSGIKTSPAVTTDFVYVVNDSGMLYALERQTFEVVWEFRLGTASSLGAQALFVSSPAVAGGRAYVGTPEGFLCVGEAATERSVLQWPGPLGVAGELRGRRHAPGNPQDIFIPPPHGAFEGSYPKDQEGKDHRLAVVAPPAIAGDRLLVPLAEKTRVHPRPGLACLPAQGEGMPDAVWFHATPNGVHAAPVVHDRRVWIVDGLPGEPDRSLACLALEDGRSLWSVSVSGAAVLAVSERVVVTSDAPGSLACYSHEGRLIWSQPVGPVSHLPALCPALAVVACGDAGDVAALDLSNGATLWRVKVSGALTAPPLVEKARVWAATSEGLKCLSLADGRSLPGWRCEGGGVSAAFAVLAEAVAYVNVSGELVMVQREDGTVVARVPGAVPGFCPLVARDMLLYFGKESILRMPVLDRAQGPVPWLDTSWLGRPITSLLTDGTHLYFGSAGWGLVRAGGAE